MSEQISPYFTSPRPEVLRHVPEEAKRILEVGCGAGVLARALTERGAEVVGLERDPAAAAVAQAHCARVLVGDAGEVDLGSESPFDCIIYADVLEHLIDPWSTVRRQVRWLRPGGTVVASVPNVRNARLLSRLIVFADWIYADSGLLDRTHLRFFTRRTAEQMLRDAGLSIEVVDCNRERLPRPFSWLPSASAGEFSVVQWIFVARR